MVALTLLFVGVIGRTADLQLVSAERYVAYGVSQRLRTEPLPASRGSLLDRHGAELVLSAPAHTIWADPRHVTDPAGAAAGLAPLLGLDEAVLRERLSRPSGFEYLARQVDADTAASVAELRSAGVYLRPEPARNYSSGELARAVLGAADIDGKGVSGLELQFDDLLTGTDGELVFERSLNGGIAIPVGEHQVSPPQRGSDLVLTIDRSLQYLLEDALGDWIGEMAAHGAMAIVTVPSTGEILAMSSLVADAETAMVVPTGYNQTVVDTFAPGSVAKLVTVAASLEEGLSTPHRTLRVPDRIRVANSWFHDHTPHATEDWSVSRILVDSSNVGAIMLGQELGPELVSDYMGQFGFGASSGLGFPGESSGLVRSHTDWHGSDIGGAVIGTGISVTAVQVLSAYNVIANGGVFTPLRLVDAYIGPDGTRTPLPQAEARRVLSEATSRQVADILSEVVSEGTGRRAAVAGYTVAGKTGTAWRRMDDGSFTDAAGNRQYMATFEGFAPVEEPRVSVIVVLDRPRNAYSGGGAAAPAFSRIAEHALRLLDVPPTGGVVAADGRSIIAFGVPAGSSQGRVRAPVTPAPTSDGDGAMGLRVVHEQMRCDPSPLRDLLGALDEAEVTGDIDGTIIDDLAYDSRQVVAGALFFCVPGAVVDGHGYADEAVTAGAVAVVCERTLDIGVPQVRVPDARVAMARISGAFFGHPADAMDMIGITGTNGKTTTARMVAAIFIAAGRQATSIGTLSGPRTTPEAPDLQRQLAACRAAETSVVALEVSSHALVQHRVDAMVFDAAVFTNLSRDHLDFHGTMDAYFRAKAMLFQADRAHRAVVNLDDPYGRLLSDAAAIPTVGFSMADAEDLQLEIDHSAFTWRGERIELAMGGRFNVSNALAAATVASQFGVSPAEVARGLSQLGPVEGRFEIVDLPAAFRVVVDFAHTPDGLHHLLQSAREVVGDGHIHLVFGCGGDKDRTKRRPMGEVAGRLADQVIVTSDNPRSEDPDAIIAEIQAGMTTTETVHIEPDRRTAIAKALAQAAPGDLVLVAGRGHEELQIIGERQIPFSDRDVVVEEFTRLTERAR